MLLFSPPNGVVEQVFVGEKRSSIQLVVGIGTAGGSGSSPLEGVFPLLSGMGSSIQIPSWSNVMIPSSRDNRIRAA